MSKQYTSQVMAEYLQSPCSVRLLYIRWTGIFFDHSYKHLAAYFFVPMSHTGGATIHQPHPVRFLCARGNMKHCTVYCLQILM